MYRILRSLLIVVLLASCEKEMDSYSYSSQEIISMSNLPVVCIWTDGKIKSKTEYIRGRFSMLERGVVVVSD